MRLVAFGTEPVGVIAIGANATGIIAIGQLATGVVAVGQLARGVVVFGQLAIGIAAVGQLAVGVGWVGGMLAIGSRRGPGLLPLSPTRTPWRLAMIAVLGVLWWLSVGTWLTDAITEPGGIFRDVPPPPPPTCADAGGPC